MENKIRKTFTIDPDVFNNFKIIANKMAISKSKYVENKIKEFIEENKKYLN